MDPEGPAMKCLFALAMALAVSGFSQSSQQILERAVSLHEQGRPAEALELYRILLERGHTHPDLLTNMGAAYAALGNYREAIATYERAVASGGDSPDLHFNLGVVYYKSQQPEPALAEFSRVLELDPSNGRARLLAADLWFQRGETTRVIKLLQPLGPSAGEDPAVAYLLGTALILEGRPVEGQFYIDAVMRRPDNAPAHVMLATAHLRAGELEDAVREIRRAIELAPELAGSHAMLGQILLRLKQLDQAEAAFRREMELNPGSFDANLHLGALLKDRGAYDEARPFLTRAVELRPRAAEALFQLGELQLFMGELQPAQATLEELVRHEPRFIRGHALLAAVYHRLGRPDDAAREQEAVVRLTAEEDAARRGQPRRPFEP
jgi:Tfp pilus assembly protein PilF